VERGEGNRRWLRTLDSFLGSLEAKTYILPEPLSSFSWCLPGGLLEPGDALWGSATDELCSKPIQDMFCNCYSVRGNQQLHRSGQGKPTLLLAFRKDSPNIHT
jgi:hypothetical protein